MAGGTIDDIHKVLESGPIHDFAKGFAFEPDEGIVDGGVFDVLDDFLAEGAEELFAAEGIGVGVEVPVQ